MCFQFMNKMEDDSKGGLDPQGVVESIKKKKKKINKIHYDTFPFLFVKS